MGVRAAARLGVLLLCMARATEVDFTPGPGLTQTGPNTYSRELTPEYLAAAGVGSEENETAPAQLFDAFGNPIPVAEDENATTTRTDLEVFLDTYFDWVIPFVVDDFSRWHFLGIVAWLWAVRWAARRCARYVWHHAPLPRRRYFLPLVLFLLVLFRYDIFDFVQGARGELARRAKVAHDEVVKELTEDRPWTFNFSQHANYSESNETIARSVAKAKRLHKDVEAMHRQLAYVNGEMDREKTEHRRLEAQLDAERAALAQVLATHRAVAGEIAGLADALGLEAGALEAEEREIVKAIRGRAKDAALLSAALEELTLLNETEYQILKREKEKREKQYNDTLAAIPKEREEAERRRLKTVKTQADLSPAFTEEGHLNMTAVYTALWGHFKLVYWKRSGWETFYRDMTSDPVKHGPLYLARRRDVFYRDCKWLRNTIYGTYVERCFWDYTKALNATLVLNLNATLEDVGDALRPPLFQAWQVFDELRLVVFRWGALLWRALEPPASRAATRYGPKARDAARNALRRAARRVAACEAAPEPVRRRADLAVLAVILAPAELWLLKKLLSPPVGLVRDYLRDFYWIFVFLPATLAWWLLWPVRCVVAFQAGALALSFAEAALALADARGAAPPPPPRTNNRGGARAVRLEDGDLL